MSAIASARAGGVGRCRDLATPSTRGTLATTSPEQPTGWNSPAMSWAIPTSFGKRGQAPPPRRVSNTPPVSTPEVLWTPSLERIERSNLRAYQRWLERSRGLKFDSYHDLWQWSVDDL